MTKMRAYLCAALGALAIGCGDEVKIVEVEPTKVDLRNMGDTAQLHAKALNAKGASVRETPAFTYTSENPGIADVSSTGLVKATGNGNTAVIVKTPQGVKGEAFVSVCLPKELVCDPMSQLDLRVNSGAPIKCHVLDCNEQLIPEPKISFDILAANVAKVDPAVASGQRGIMSLPVTGLMEGDTEVKVVAYNFDKTVRVHVGPALVIPGEAEYYGKKGGGGGGKKKGDGSGDNFSGGKGGFNHILNNMKF